MKRSRLVMLPFLALLVGTMACSTCCERDRQARVDRRHEPEVRRVAQRAGPEQPAEVANAFNVLFLGDGFSGDEQLDTYRATVARLARGLVGQPPFCNYAERIGFLRIDVDDPQGSIDRGDCTADLGPLPRQAGPTLPDVVVSTGAIVWSEDLGVTASGGCRLLWLDADGQFRAFELAAIAPAVSAVIVVANTTLPAAGAYQQSDPAAVGLMVVGVPVDDSGAISEQADLLLAHELGHVLGLSDEYGEDSVDALSDPPAPFVQAPNVWRPTCGPPWTAGVNQMEWTSLLAAGCRAEGMLDCRAAYDAAAVNPCPLVQTPPECVYVSAEPDSANAAPACPGAATVATAATGVATCVNHRCEAVLGAWEGAYYHDRGYFRPRSTCRMERLSAEVPFCEVCGRHLHARLCAYGAATTPACGAPQGAAAACL